MDNGLGHIISKDLTDEEKEVSILLLVKESL